MIDDLVYIIGGYVTKDGLNEYVHVLNMKNHDYYPVKFSGGLEPVGKLLRFLDASNNL